MYRILAFLGLMVLGLLLAAYFLLGGHHGSKTKTTSTQSQVQPLPSYANTDAQVSMTIDGEVNGDDIHRQIKITVSQSQRDMDVIQGYSGNVINHQQFYNTEDAYNVFLNALNTGGFLLPLKNSKAPAASTGQCPLGFRYIFVLNQNGSNLSNLWASTCSQSLGTFGGNSQLIQDLFEEQIPTYQATANTVDL